MKDSIVHHNRLAWNRQAAKGCRWAQPVSSSEVAAARDGQLAIVLTPTRSVPTSWLGDLAGARVLALASGGGQQVPLLAAAGARVTSYDLSDIQLAQDQLVADRERLVITCRQGDMRSLPFADASFDLIINPVSVCFVPEVLPVWRECARVLRPGGRLLSGLLNPVFFLFDADAADREGRLVVANRLPYREDDADSLPPGRRAEIHDDGEAMEFSHSLGDLLGGPLQAGLVITDLYEDRWGEDSGQPLDPYLPCFLAVRWDKFPG